MIFKLLISLYQTYSQNEKLIMKINMNKNIYILLALLIIQPTLAADSNNLSDLLIKKGIITQEDLDNLDKGVSIEQLLFNKGVINQVELTSLLNKKIEQEPVSLVSSTERQEVKSNVLNKSTKKPKNDNPVSVGFTKKGLTVKSDDGNWSTNLQWRAQMRLTDPYRSDPRQISHFNNDDETSFELRRARMKIGGHGYKPWLKYYFEVDLQPTRSTSDSSTAASSRLIDWRITLDKYEALSFRAGQWKINYNRERVDSSGRQTFVERSIANRVFTTDRQVGVMAFGRLFNGSPADLNYYLGIFNGEGRGVKNDDSDMLHMARLQWNFLGRELKWRQSDTGFSEDPAGTLAFATSSTQGKCTRWSSSGCGNLDGFEAVSNAAKGQFEIDQIVQETAFKWRGFAWQQEYHKKKVNDVVNNTRSELTGGYAQAGYFFNQIFPTIPKKVEFALRYAFVDEPNKTDISNTNTRKEYTGAINYFISDHNNKLTLDYSHLTLDDGFLDRQVSDNRLRFQWDISF